MQPPTEIPTASDHSMYTPQLRMPLLRHRSISQDLQVVAALQQTSKELQAAVAQLLHGQLPVVLRARQLQQPDSFAQWLLKHGGLLQSLEVTSDQTTRQTVEHYKALEDAIVAAAEAAAAAPEASPEASPEAAPGLQFHLQSLSLNLEAEPRLLQHLPAAHLTRLDARIQLSCRMSVRAVADLTSLRQLRLVTFSDRNTIGAASPRLSLAHDALAPLAAGLQQLTDLRIGKVQPAHLQHLPPRLQELRAAVTVDWGSTADLAALCKPELTALRSLNIGQDKASGCGQHSDDVLAQLSVLQQLTYLRLGEVRRGQLQHLQLPKLLQLVVLQCAHRGRWQQLQLGQLTAVSKLTLGVDCESSLRKHDQLPINLQELKYGISGSRFRQRTGGTLQPLLASSRLQKLDIIFAVAPGVTADELKQLSSLSSLQELRLLYAGCTAADAAAAAPAWRSLPLKSLVWTSSDAPAVVQQLGELHGLTHLKLQAAGWPRVCTSRQLAAALQQLSRLRHLVLQGPDSRQSAALGPAPGAAADCGTGGVGDVWRNAGGVARILQAMAGLGDLQGAHVVLPVQLQESAVQQLRYVLPQLLPRRLARCCEVSKSRVAVKLCSEPRPFSACAHTCMCAEAAGLEGV
ncbi:hypothetical protein COO60DRAFT_282268 [Scenedesmus sp. NREL 46B-D3]|nr:hypothetical protein COO60DRAFT_282268 [Scenedesmus sp. NREL 46B-D3]